MAEPLEQDVNRRLRRADWRFLLPTPRPTRALCRAGGNLADAVARMAVQVVTDGTDGDCDLAVAEDPGRVVLRELLQALRPGGACYTEWRASRSNPWQIERALRDAGFEHVTCYRPWPASTELPLYWIPVGAAGAAAYVRSRKWLPGGRVRRLLAGVRQRARDLARGQWIDPICAVARRPADNLREEFGPTAWLRETWPEWGLGPIPERLSLLLVTGGPRSVSKVVMLAFAEPEPVPLVAVKAPRVDVAAAGIRREATALASPAVRLPGVPRLLSCREVDGVPLLAETALAGRPLEGVLTRRNLLTWSTKVTDWLATLAGVAPPLSGDYWRQAFAEPVLSRFVERFGQVADRALVGASEEIIGEVGPLPPVTEQRDFSPWNVLVTTAGDLAVLDWESAEVSGLPALDLLYYLAYASFNIERAHDVKSRILSYRRLLDPSTHIGAVRRHCLERYLEALGLEHMQLRPLRVLVWMIHAQSEYCRAAADVGGPPPRGLLAQSLFLALWTEEVRDLAGR